MQRSSKFSHIIYTKPIIPIEYAAIKNFKTKYIIQNLSNPNIDIIVNIHNEIH